jgi:maleate isomerase
LAEVTRVGVIVPSSNTVLEAELARLAPPGGPVAVHVTRVRVTAISLEAGALAQFGPEPMTAAAGLLGDTLVNAVAWGGTAGSWLGLDHDRALAAGLARAAGAPATTSTLALLGACRDRGITRIGLLTPYTGDVVERIIATFAAQGVAVDAERHLGLTANHSFAAVSPDELTAMARACADDAAPAGACGAGGGMQAFMVLCTNVRGGGQVAARITAATGLPVLDSCEVTLAAAIAAAARPTRQDTAGQNSTGQNGMGQHSTGQDRGTSAMPSTIGDS